MDRSIDYYLLRQKALANKFSVICHDYINGTVKEEKLYSYLDYVNKANDEYKLFCVENNIRVSSLAIINPSNIMRCSTAMTYRDALTYLEDYDVDKEFDFDQEVLGISKSSISEEPPVIEEPVEENITPEGSSLSDDDSSEEELTESDLSSPGGSDVSKKDDDLDVSDEEDLSSDEVGISSDDADVTEDISEEEKAAFDEMKISFGIWIDQYLQEVENAVSSLDKLKKFGDPINGYSNKYSYEEIEKFYNEDPDVFYVIKEDIKKRVISDSLLPDLKYKELESDYALTLAQCHRKIRALFDSLIKDQYSKKYFPDKLKNLYDISYDDFLGFCNLYEYNCDNLPQFEPISVDRSIVSKDEKKKITGIKNSKAIRFADAEKCLDEMIQEVLDLTGEEYGSSLFNYAFNDIIGKNTNGYDADSVNSIKEKYNQINDFLKNEKVVYNHSQIHEIDLINPSASLNYIKLGIGESKDKGKRVASEIVSRAIPFAASIALRRVPIVLAGGAAIGAYFGEKSLDKVIEKKEAEDKQWSKIAKTALQAIRRTGVYSVISKLGYTVGAGIAATSLIFGKSISNTLKNFNYAEGTNYDRDKVKFDKKSPITSIKKNIGIYLNDPEKLQKLKETAYSICATSFIALGSKTVGDIINNSVASLESTDSFSR